MKTMEIYLPAYLTKETQLCITKTLYNLGVWSINVSDNDEEMIEIHFKEEIENQILTFLNFVAIADCGGVYTKNLTDKY